MFNLKLERFKNLEKLDYIFNKIKYIIEFLISVMFSYVVFRIVFIKHNYGYISAKHLVYIVPIALILILNVLYCLYKSEKKIEKIFISFIIPIGMLYWIFMMPSQVADEMAHLWRAYEVSEGIFISSNKNETKVPKDLIHNIKPYVGNYSQMVSVTNDTPEFNDLESVNNTAKTYPATLYLFSGFGFFIGRIFKLSFIISAYLAKLFNFIIFIIAGYYIIKIIPIGKFAMFTLLFTPMVLHQATSTSADAMVNISCLLFISYSVKLLFKKEKILTKELVLYFIIAVFISIAKYVYLPLIGISFLFIKRKDLDFKGKIIIISSIIISGIVAIVCYKYSLTYPGAYDDYLNQVGANSTLQLKYMKENPLKALEMIRNTLVTNGNTYLKEAMGLKLGWANIFVNDLWIGLFIIILFASCYLEKNEFVLNMIQKSWMILISFGIICLIIIGLYISWTPVGLEISTGIQGRYFIPIIPLILLCLSLKENYIKIKNIEYKLPIILSIINIPVIMTVIKFFS